MGLNLQQQLLASYHRLLRPLVRILLRQGMAYSEFSEIVKTVYVDVAREDFTPAGKKATDSRVAILTGLTRKDVKRLRDALDSGDADYPSASAADAHRATRVLSGWHQDPDFCDDQGLPLALPEDGASPNFQQLVKRYSGDMPARAMLDELERVKAVVRNAQGQLEVQSRSYIPSVDDPQGLRMFGTAVHDLMATIDHNLNQPSQTTRYMQRVMSNDRVASKALPVFRRIAADRGQDLLEWLDDWLSQHEVAAPSDSDQEQEQEKSVRAGVGIYFFQDECDSPNSTDTDD